MKVKVGVDLDGTVTRTTFLNPDFKIPQWLFFFLVPFFLFAAPNKKIVNMLKRMVDNGNEILIISARPPWAAKLTRRWLKRNDVPFSDIFCVGFGKGSKQRKLEVIKKEKIKLFFDDENGTIEFLTHNSVGAILVHFH